MEKNILRIKTLSNGERRGISISTEYEKKSDKDYACLDQKYHEELLNRLDSKEYSLDNIEGLPDGDYPINNFEEIICAAPFVPYGEQTPTHTTKTLLIFIGNE